jgi:hypothetical protein
MSLLVIDDDDPQVYVELRGQLVDVISDPTGDFYVRLGRRYGKPDKQPPPDKANRVILTPGCLVRCENSATGLRPDP